MKIWQRICLEALLCLPVLALAQQAPAPAQSQPPSPPALLVQQLTVGSTPAADNREGRIHLDVVVTDKSGNAVTGLGLKDFTLLDNGQPEKILNFQAFGAAAARPDPPVELILVIDAVNQSNNQVSHVMEEVDKFLGENGGHLAQPVSIYRFSDRGLSVTPQPSTDGNALAAEISPKGELHILWGDQQDSRLNGRLLSRSPTYRSWASLKALGSIVLTERLKPRRKLMVWLGSGWPPEGGERSFEWITEFSTRLREAGIALSSATSWPYPKRSDPYLDFVDGVQSAWDANPGALALEVLATQSGGRVLDPSDSLADLIANCVRDASAYYTISFDPPPAEQPDEYHALKVLTRNPDLEVRTNSGYYDEPVYYDQPQRANVKIPLEILEQRLGMAPSMTDAEMARMISGLELSERLSGARLSYWRARLHGAETLAALTVLADASAFLDPPAAEIPATPAPDRAAQGLMLSRTVRYLIDTIPKLPNFFATRTKVLYSEPPPKDDQAWKIAPAGQSLRLTRTSSATILYRDGAEDVDSGAEKQRKQNAEDAYLNTRGTFGPILGMVMLDAVAPRSELNWSRWEQGATGVQAVFRYQVPEGNSHYQVSYCCVLEGNQEITFQQVAGYHGEIAIDPVSGAILRLTVEADLKPSLPVLRSSILVEYGSEEIGGKNYICPVRSVSIERGRTMILIREWGESFRVCGPFQTMMSDVSFADYHMFRSESRILTGDDAAPEGNQGESGSRAAPPPVPKKQP